jgi:hypothetical protein
MERGAEGGDAVGIVRGFLEGLGGRRPTRAEVLTIRRPLEDLYERVLRLRTSSPDLRDVDLGDDVKMLLQILKSKGGGLRSAASFL